MGGPTSQDKGAVSDCQITVSWDSSVNLDAWDFLKFIFFTLTALARFTWRLKLCCELLQNNDLLRTLRDYFDPISALFTCTSRAMFWGQSALSDSFQLLWSNAF